MLAAAPQLAKTRYNLKPSFASRPATSSRSLPRFYSQKGIPIATDDKWKVINKPYKETVTREQVQTKRKVALKYVTLGTLFLVPIAAIGYSLTLYS